MAMKCFIPYLLPCLLLLSCGSNDVPEAKDEDTSSTITPPDTAVLTVDSALSILFLGVETDTLDVNPLNLPSLSIEVRSSKGLAQVACFRVKQDKSASLIRVVSAFDTLVYRATLTPSELGLSASDVAGLRVAAEDVEEGYAQRQLAYRFADPGSLAPAVEFTNVADDTLRVNSDPNAVKPPAPCFRVVSPNLDTVKLYVIRATGAALTATLHGVPAASFPIGGDYSACFEGLTYTDDMVALRVYAVSKLSLATTLDLPLKVALDLNAPPIVKFLTGDTLRLNTHPGAAKPYVQLRVTSGVGLSKLAVERYNNDTDIPLAEVTSFGGDGKDFTREIAELTPAMFGSLEKIVVDAYDLLGKRTSVTLPVTRYAADPLIDELSAFPGAEGFGKNVTGGRGGAVYYVTTLTDGEGAGTLRHAVKQQGARTIVFKVSGTIQLTKRLSIDNGNLTIAGQTAPGDGICLAGYDVVVSNADNVIIRYLRFRMGAANGVESDAIWSRGRSNVIVDHCSMSWSTDECASFYEMQSFTMQWCLIAESLKNSLHEKGAHGYGGIWGGRNATFHHNLLAHHDSRNPRFASGENNLSPVDYRNNVIYNWGNTNSAYGGEATDINIVNNYYKPGPATKSSLKERIYAPGKKTEDDGSGRFVNIIGQYGRMYVAGNYVEGSDRATGDNWTYGIQGVSDADKAAMKRTAPFAFEPITEHSAQAACERVLSHAGASLRRDAVDTRIVGEVRSGTFTYSGSNGSTKGIIDSQNDVGAWPALGSLPAPLDSDSDGMPDAWEAANGLNPNSAADRNLKTLSSVYTNLEVYLSAIVEHITTAQRKS
jgi:pectate lyase